MTVQITTEEIKSAVEAAVDPVQQKLKNYEEANKALADSLAKTNEKLAKIEVIEDKLSTQANQIENLAKNPANPTFASTSLPETTEGYKTFIQAVAKTAAGDAPVALNPKKLSFVDNQGRIITKADNDMITSLKSLNASYNIQGLQAGKVFQALADETVDTLYAKVLQYVNTINTGDSLKTIDFPFINGDDVDAYWEGETVAIQETGNPAIRDTELKLHAITSKYKQFSHRLFKQMQNGDLNYDVFATFVRYLELKAEKKKARAILNGSGSNAPLGLLTDYNNRGTAVGYGERSVAVADLAKVENLINLAYSLSDDILDEGGKFTMFVHRDILNLLDVATGAAEQMPNRSDTKIQINRLELVAKLKSSLGVDIDVVGLRSEYGLGKIAGTVGAFIGKMSYYTMASSSVSEMFTEKVPGQNGYIMSRIAYAGGTPTMPKAFSMMKLTA